MNLYLLTQSVNKGYDTYDSFVVAALDEEEAKFTHPSDYVDYGWNPEKGYWEWETSRGRANYHDSSWTSPGNVKVIYLGEAEDGLKNREVICASFNAG